MAAVQCDNFIGNAWKKDLCLNCFKSKEEHVVRNGHSHPTLMRIPDPPKEGILKGTKSNSSLTSKGNKVIFLNNEFEIIGFGGDDVYSEDEDYPDIANNGQTEEEEEEETEEDRAFQKLTKTNTDYNSIAENLQEPKEGRIKKVIEPLKLGKQVFDDKGNKKTLLVSVTPFGGDSGTPKTKINGVRTVTSGAGKETKINGHSESSFKSEPVRNESTVSGKVDSNNKTEAVVNGDVIKESLPKENEAAVKEKSEKVKNSTEVAQINSNEDCSAKGGMEKSIKRSQPLDKNLKFRVSKDLQKENEKNAELNGKEENKNDKIKTSDKVNNLIDKAKKKVNQFPVITDSSTFKFKTKDFTNGSAKKTTENNKAAVVLDIYKIQEKEDVKTNNEKNEEKTIKRIVVSPEIRNKFLSSEVKISTALVDVGKEKSEKISNETNKVPKTNTSVTETEVVVNRVENSQNGVSIDRSKLVPNVSSLYRHHFKSAKKESEENKSEQAVSPVVKTNGIVSSLTLVPNFECTYSENEKSVDGDKIETKEVEEKSLVDSPETVPSKEKEKETGKEEKFKKTSFDSLENFEKIIKGEEITLFSAEENCQNEEKVGEDKDDVVPDISRESAGEPDGRADSDDLSEPPALPSKPPPPLTESRTNFLQDLTIGGSDGIKILSEKPKVPAKPIIIQSKKINFQSPVQMNRPKSPSIEKFLDVTSSPLSVKSHPPLQESLSSDSSKNQKRPAPKPPSPKDESCRREEVAAEEEVKEPESKVVAVIEEPVVKESVKGISRSTENLLEFITGQDGKDQLNTDGLEEISMPEPVPRRSLSLSHDSLVPCDVGDVQAKKKPSRGRFFLRKLLHLGKPKDSSKDLNRQKSPLPSGSKPKLEIIHPNDLNGSRVEVVPPARTSKSRRTSSSASSSSGEQRESDVLSDSSASHSVSSSGNDSQSTIDRSKKPPPPPRGHSLETWNAKPARPPPPKSIDILRQANSSWCNGVDSKSDNLYVNLAAPKAVRGMRLHSVRYLQKRLHNSGEARSGLAPNKPVRTGSLREGNMEATKRLVTVTTPPTTTEDSDYESFVVANGQYLTSSLQSDDNLYECVQVSSHRSSLPECDSSLTDPLNNGKGKRSSGGRNSNHRRSEGNVDFNSDYFKMKFMRSVSLPYCASETESEMYSPYSFYGSELGEEDYELTSTSGHTYRSSRLKLKKGRSIVHKNLEDNYGAVIVANHEALAQVVEQMKQGPSPPPSLRGLSTAVNLRWTDFTIAKDAVGVVVERRVFYPALWGIHNVTLSLMAEQGLNSSLHVKGPFNLNPLAELNDLVPASFLPMLKKDGSDVVQASISVLTRLQIETVETYGRSMNANVLNEESKKEVNFVLLQIINAFKSLQAQGIEDAPKNLTNLIVCREEKDPHPRICITHSFERSEDATSKSSLCQCVTHAIQDILPPTDLTPLISTVLRKEKAVSLSQAKGILEFSLWGPADISFGNSNRERESALQRWLDLERATVLHGLVRTRAELTVFEEWQLLFLVRTNAKMMAEASLLLESGIYEDVSTA